MNLPRSTFFAELGCEKEDAVVGEITAITETRRGYGYRRVNAELLNRGMVVNSRKVRRIMRENGLNPKRKRSYVQTTDSDHDSAIYPNVAKDCEVHGPDQLWVGNITYIAIATGFAYLAVILDAWSRKVVGYALGRNVDVRLTTGAMGATTEARRPLPGCVFHSDRGSQYAAAPHRRRPKRHGIFGSMSRRGNPYAPAPGHDGVPVGSLRLERQYRNRTASWRPPEVRPGDSRHQCNDRTHVAFQRLRAEGLVAAIGGLMHTQMDPGRARACSHVPWLAWILPRYIATRCTSDSAHFVCQRFSDSLPVCRASSQNSGAYRIHLDTEPRPDDARIHAQSLCGILRRGHSGGVPGH